MQSVLAHLIDEKLAKSLGLKTPVGEGAFAAWSASLPPNNE